MIFAAEEYDAGASLHVSQPASQRCQALAFKVEERQCPHFDLKLNVIKCLSC
jgi:hypothetical protein